MTLTVKLLTPGDLPRTLLRYEPVAGAEVILGRRLTFQLTPEPPTPGFATERTSTGEMVWSVLAVEGDRFTIGCANRSSHVEPPARPSALDGVNLDATAVLDRTGRVLSMSEERGTDLTGVIRRFLLTLLTPLPLLPEEPVGIGARWTVTRPPSEGSVEMAGTDLVEVMAGTSTALALRTEGRGDCVVRLPEGLPIPARLSLVLEGTATTDLPLDGLPGGGRRPDGFRGSGAVGSRELTLTATVESVTERL